MVEQVKTNTITMTGADLLTAVVDFLNKQDVEGKVDDLVSITINESGLLDSSVSGAVVLDETVAAVTIILPLP